MNDEISESAIPQIPDFDLIREIGSGGFGHVWLARNRATESLRAVKLIPLATADAVDPAGRELVSVKRLESIRLRQHPNLLDIQHVGQTESHVFLVTDLADNAKEDSTADDADYVPATLERRLAAEPISVTECFEWSQQLLNGLASLHAAGMVHRDVKPANCLFVDGQLKLADFGLLTFADTHNSSIGTRAYMPPDGQMDARADVYAAGLVIYEMITGYPVERFPQLGEHTETILSEPVSSALVRLVLDACQSNRASRFADATAMVDTLKRSSSGESPASRSRYVALVLLGVVLTALMAFGWYCKAPWQRVHVNFVSYPFGATVLVDGKLQLDGKGHPATTPCTIENLPRRRCEVEFQLPDQDPLELGTIDFNQQRQVVGDWEKRDDVVEEEAEMTPAQRTQ